MTTKEKQKAARQKWNLANKQKMIQYRQNHYAKNREKILAEYRRKNPFAIKTDLKLETILKAISDFYKISIEEIKSDCRSVEVSKARHIYFYLSKIFTNEILYTIGIEINRNHTTVLHGYNKILNELDIYSSLRNEILELKTILNPKENIIIVQDVDLLTQIVL